LGGDDRTDVLVIGAGAAGAAVVWMLARAGVGVVCLEQGDWVDPRALPHWRADWELHRHTDWSAEPNVRRLPQDYPVNDAGSPISPLMYNAVGGSTIHWSAHFPRFRPSDFRVRSLDGVADDWPIDYATLEPFFDMNDRMMGVAGITGDPAYPPKSPRQTPPIPLDTLGATMARGFDRLGWHWWPSDSAILTRDYDGRRACINCGPCDLGCPTGAKASTDITYWPKALASGARLETRARVREITLGPDGRVDGALYHDGEGRPREQKARAVVLAANGIGTPRLLLNSRSARFPDGLANQSGLVGRNLMFHPYAMVRGVFDQPLGGHRGPIGCSLISQEFYETDLSRGFVRGYSFELLRGMGPVSTALWGMSAGRLPWGAGHHEAYADVFARTAGVLAICEDLPELHNCVTLDPELTDGNGIPAPRIQYRLSENSQRMLEHGVARGRQVLEAAGAEWTRVESPLRVAGWHLMGTARMGSDPQRSVVNEWGRCHDVRNLFIIDGSVFVTAGAVNPTCTIQAFALHAADRLQKNLANLLD
jgi:choline dehydrogenase-like flavoprotein